MAKKSATTRLNAARAAHAAITTQIAEKEAVRNAALLAGEEAAAIANIDAEIASLQHAGRTESDRIRLLEAEAAKEKQAAVAKQQHGHINRFAKLLADADADAEEMQELARQLLKTTRRCIERRERALAGFSVRSSHASAAARAADGAAMSADAVMTLLAHEFYRISADPSLGGVPGRQHELNLPGAKYPNLQLQLQPEKIVPFAVKLKAASEFAVQTLKNEIGGAITAPIAAPPNPIVTRSADKIQVEMQAEADVRDAKLLTAAPKPAPPLNGGSDVEPRRRTAHDLKLAALLERQAEAAEDMSPEGERRYEKIVAEIAALNEGALS